ncbi:MAG: DUF1697 domain-containing protein [Pseudomonadota bacterium]
MTAYVALLRAVNVAGTGKLPMAKLRAMATELGLANVRTYIASGNLLFESELSEREVKAALETRLEVYAGKAVPIFVRTAAEMAAVHAADPFPDAHGSRHMVYFLDVAPPDDTQKTARDQAGERIALGTREIYVDYGDGIRFTKLKLAATKIGTARNMNTVAKLVAMMSLKGG